MADRKRKKQYVNRCECMHLRRAHEWDIGPCEHCDCKKFKKKRASYG